MKFAPIVPVRYLDSLGSLSNYHLVLSQWLSEPSYCEFYSSCWDRGDTLILDNGAYELNTSVPFDDLLQSYQRLGGSDIVVIPDTNEGNNLDLAEEFSSYIDAFRNINSKVKFMVVPHSLEEVKPLIQLGYADIIGLNKDFARTGRSKVIEKLLKMGVDKQFHLLGVYRNPIKEVADVLKFKDLIIGMDSSMPYRIAKSGRKLEEYRPYPKVINFYEDDLSEPILKHCVSEFEWFIDYVGKR